jgi:DNA primase large subunit
LTLDRLLDDFDLSGGVDPTGDGRFSIDVTAYLELAADVDGPKWRLAGRPLSDGSVPITRPELYTLLREAVARRVGEGLPLSVPDGIAEPLSEELSALRRSVADLDPPMSFEAVVPGLFPPCMRALLSRVREGESLPDHSRFSLLSFLLATGLDADETIELCDVSADAADADAIRAQLDRLRDEDSAVAAPPSCAVMDEYGDCVDADETCETIQHPLSYYETKLQGTPDDRIADWRQ